MTLITTCPGCHQPRSDIEATRAQHARVLEIENQVAATHKALRQWQDHGDWEKTLENIHRALDEWTELRGEVVRALTELQRALTDAKSHLRQRRNQIIDDASGFNRAPTWEERNATYERQLGTEQLIVDDIEALVKGLEGLRFDLDHLHKHWYLRSVDIRWREDRISGPQSSHRN